MPVKVICCSAREDKLLWDRLKKHLVLLPRQEPIERYEYDVSADTAWKQEISKHLSEVQIILLLISPDFMTSDYCYSIEMLRTLELHGRGEVQVIPVIFRPVLWQRVFGELQPLPEDARPITLWGDRDVALFRVIKGIHKAIENLNMKGSRTWRRP